MSQPALPAVPTTVRRCLFSRCLKSLQGRRSNTKWCSPECRYQAAAYERHYWNCPVCDLQQKRIRGFAPWCPTCEPPEPAPILPPAVVPPAVVPPAVVQRPDQERRAQQAAVQRAQLEREQTSARQRAAIQRVKLEQQRVKTMQQFTRDKHRWLASLLLAADNKQGSSITYHGALKWQQLLSQLTLLEGRLAGIYQRRGEDLTKPLPR